MILPCTIHNHTTYCDGKNTIARMVDAAIRKNFQVIGFSGHMYTSFDSHFCMSKRNTKNYIDEINLLKDVYKDRISILLGCENDFYSPKTLYAFDYCISAVHYIKMGNDYLCVDDTPQTTVDIVNTYFDGDYMEYCKKYYETIAATKRINNNQIIGHFDILTKFNDNDNLFSQDDALYRKYALDAMEKLVKKKFIFELNTGGVYKGYKKMPYPDMDLLCSLQEMNGEIIITSDSHSIKSLDFMFDQCITLARENGFKYIKQIDDNGFYDFRI